MKHAVRRVAVAMLFLAPALLAQIDVSRRTIHVYRRAEVGDPLDESIQITAGTGSASWSIGTVTGPLAPYMQATPTSGTAPSTMTIIFRGKGSEQLGLGDRAAIVPVIQSGGNTVNITITLTTVRKRAWEYFSYMTGYENGVGCTKSHAVFLQNDACVVTNELPAAWPNFILPAVGGSYVDPQFGAKITRMTDNRGVQYSGRKAISATNKYLLAGRYDGTVYVYNIPTGTVAYSAVPGNQNYIHWDPSNDDLYYYLGWNDAKIHQYRLSTATDTVIANYQGAPYNFTGLLDGGTFNMSDDGYMAFWNAGWGKACVADVVGMTVQNQDSHTHCWDLSSNGLVWTSIDSIAVSQVDLPTGKRYMLMMGDPRATFWQLKDGVVTFSHTAPTDMEKLWNGPVGAVSTPHSGFFRASDGQVYWDCGWNSGYSGKGYQAVYRVSAGQQMGLAEEVGGGQRLSYLTCYGCWADAHHGCSDRLGGCVTAYFNDPGEYGTALNNQLITAATSTNPAVITTASNHGWSTNREVFISWTEGNTCINGKWAITKIADNQFSIPVNCSGAGAYVANSGVVVNADPVLTSRAYRNEMIITRPGEEVRRVAVHRARMLGNTFNSTHGQVSYYGYSPKSSISYDGCYIAFMSNMGDPSANSAYIAETGFCPSQMMSVRSIQPTPSGAILNYALPANVSCTILASHNIDFSSPFASSISDGQSGLSRTLVLTGGTANSDTWVRWQCGLYTASRYFRTLPSLSGAGLLQLNLGPQAGITNAVVEWGYNSGSLSNTTASVPCTAGCRIELRPNRGVVYHRVRDESETSSTRPVQAVLTR
jgi:hypothetical protein